MVVQHDFDQVEVKEVIMQDFLYFEYYWPTVSDSMLSLQVNIVDNILLFIYLYKNHYRSSNVQTHGVQALSSENTTSWKPQGKLIDKASSDGGMDLEHV